MRLLACDLDGTLVGDADALAALNRTLLSRRNWVLAYVTGRSLSSAQSLIEQAGLLVPDVLATGVGSSIYYAETIPAPAWRLDPDWRAHIGVDWSAADCRNAVAGSSGLISQPAEEQSDFKCSYFVSSDRGASMLLRVTEALRAGGVAARVVYSSGRDLDLLPARAGKGNAVRYLAHRFRIPLDVVLTCGDSENDEDMLSLDCRSAAVANAHPELLERLPGSVYRCKGAFAAGVHEALEHFGWIQR